MKLKKVVKPHVGNNFPFENPDTYRTCRYCKYFECGRCHNPTVIKSQSGSFDLYEVAESGSLSSVIEETIHSTSTKQVLGELVDLLREWKISNKKIKEFEETFNSVLNQWFDFSLKDEIDEAVSGLYQDYFDNKDFLKGIEINNPAEYSCKEFM